MILIGIGGNLDSQFGPPEQGLPQALRMLEAKDLRIAKCSPWYGAHPVPVSQQPDFVNAVALVETALPPEVLLNRMQAIEVEFGRVRESVNAARALDLDLLAYGDTCLANTINIPHPRMHQRAFVMAPLCDIAPQWRHPVLKHTARELFAALPTPHGVWRL